MMQNMGEMLF